MLSRAMSTAATVSSVFPATISPAAALRSTASRQAEGSPSKSAKRAFRNHEKYKNELTEVYKEYVRTGVKNSDIDLSFLDGAIFRVALGDFSEFNMPIDIYLHDDLITIPLGNDFFTFICGNYDSYKKAESYLLKVSSNGYENAFIIAFKDGVRTDFASEF